MITRYKVPYRSGDCIIGKSLLKLTPAALRAASNFPHIRVAPLPLMLREKKKKKKETTDKRAVSYHYAANQLLKPD